MKRAICWLALAVLLLGGLTMYRTFAAKNECSSESEWYDEGANFGYCETDGGLHEDDMQ